MRVNGKRVSGPRVVEFPLPIKNEEGQEDFIVFKFRALTSKDDFETVMPRPKPPKVIKPGGEEFYNHSDKNYQKIVESWLEKKISWEFLQSISSTENLEWEKVKLEDSETWKYWREEFDEHFGLVGTNRLFSCFLEANSLDESKLEEARNRFLASQARKQSEN